MGPACVGSYSISRTSALPTSPLLPLFLHSFIPLSSHHSHFICAFAHRFYGINLNQNVVLQQIGYDGKTGTPWERLFKVSTGNLIVTALGFVPGASASDFLPATPSSRFATNNGLFVGYYASILTIEKLGRKWIQIQGFLMSALFREFEFIPCACVCAWTLIGI